MKEHDEREREKCKIQNEFQIHNLYNFFNLKYQVAYILNIEFTASSSKQIS